MSEFWTSAYFLKRFLIVFVEGYRNSSSNTNFAFNRKFGIILT